MEQDIVMESVVMEPTLVKEGWLMKRGEHFRNWRPRYFILKSEGQFLGYKNKPTDPKEPGEPCNNFTVKGCQTMISDQVKPFAFALRGLYMETVVERMFHTDNETERDEWIKSIESVRNGLDGDEATRFYNPSKIGMTDFELLKVLGRGAFGKVVLCKEKSSRTLYAMKILKKSAIFKKNDVEHTLTENRVLRSIRHPFIVGLKYSFTTDDRLCFVTEYVRGGELFIHLRAERRISEERVRFYTAELVCALGYLHSRGIIYRDLKLENILLDRNGHIKIVDFGLCKDEIFGGKMATTFCGTPSYLPPEVIRSLGYGRAVDWWGLGVVMYELLTGQLPFYSEERKAMYRLIVTEKVYYPKNLMSQETIEIISRLLAKNPDRRLGAGPADAEEIMEHPYFSSVNWSDLAKKRIIPPFKPVLQDEMDTRYVDPEFRDQKASLTPPPSRCSSEMGNHQGPAFSEFSYQNPSSIHSGGGSILSSGSSRSLEVAV